MTQVIEKLGGEYEIRTHVHGFAIQKGNEKYQSLRVSKYPLTNRERKAKVSNGLLTFQNEKDPVTAATVNRGLSKKASQLSNHISTMKGRIAIAGLVISLALPVEVGR